MKIALLRPVSPRMHECELTHFHREVIDVNKAVIQHGEYEKALEVLGCTIVKAEAAPELPDSLFVEDCAIVFEELAIITRPGAESRRSETEGIAAVLNNFKALHFITEPGTMDGGDVLQIGREVFVGVSSRTNREAAGQLRKILEPLGYSVKEVAVKDCLHLKSAITRVGEDTILLNPGIVERSLFSHFKQIETHPDEPFAANALWIDDTVIYSLEYPLTALRLAEVGIELYLLNNSEVVKAEGGVTCCSIIFNHTQLYRMIE